uniref:Uncharacterized protein n=1 Tax=viral metagenome TaxID=1070528 RepID=A0A6C0BL65_9ZZZZ
MGSRRLLVHLFLRLCIVRSERRCSRGCAENVWEDILLLSED